jgi:hypothetical protein
MPNKKRGKEQSGAAPAATANKSLRLRSPNAKADPADRVSSQSQHPEPIAKIKKRRRRRRKPLAQPVPLVAEVKSVMHRILESQREQLIQLSEDIQKVRFLGW